MHLHRLSASTAMIEEPSLIAFTDGRFSRSLCE